MVDSNGVQIAWGHSIREQFRTVPQWVSSLNIISGWLPLGLNFFANTYYDFAHTVASSVYSRIATQLTDLLSSLEGPNLKGICWPTPLEYRSANHNISLFIIWILFLVVIILPRKAFIGVVMNFWAWISIQCAVTFPCDFPALHADDELRSPNS